MPDPMIQQTEIQRMGPRPLGLHLALGGSTWISGAVALPAALAGMIPWHDTLAERAEKLMKKMSKENVSALQAAMVTEAGFRLEKALSGIDAYRKHPYRRQTGSPPSIHSVGSCRLLDYGSDTAKKDQDRVILCVPSLINPAYILDLDEKASLLCDLRDRGFRPLLIDWGIPGNDEKKFTVSDYVTLRLRPMLEAACKIGGGQVDLLGYCMGGNLALALAQLEAPGIRHLALLATPWDFHVSSSTQRQAINTMMSGVVAAFDTMGEVPVDFLQLFFTSLDPTLNDRKFRRFADMDQNSAAARLFVATEDWANDGAPLTTKVARECLHDWYGSNAPARGEWQIAGQTIKPEKIKIPAIVVIPSRDRIVPPDSARALADALPHATLLNASAGHVAMLTQTASRKKIVDKLSAFLD